MRKALLLAFLTLILLPPALAQLFYREEIRLFPFVSNGKWGFIDKAGSITIDPVYKSVSKFVSGYAVVELFDGKMTLIERNGRAAFGPVEYQILPPSEGLSRTRKGDLWGYLDMDGNVVIPFKFEEASDFQNGLARVKINRKFTFIDQKGKRLTKFYKQAYNFSEGLAIIEIDGLRGFIDRFDDIAISPEYDDADGFSQGLAAVRIGGKYGYINRSGKLDIPAKFDNARWFSDGLAPVEIAGKWGFIDRDGEFRVEPSYISVGNYYDGMAAVQINEKWGYIDKNGRIVIPAQYAKAGNFNEGIANVEICENRDSDRGTPACSLTYITRSGQLIWKPEN